MTITERNRLLKKLLSCSFGQGKVTVRGSRGTAYGWVSVHIAYAPKNRQHREDIIRMIWVLFKAAKIEIGSYGYNDPGSDYGFGSEIHFNFDPVLEREHWEAE